MQQLCELAPVPGIEIVGPLPGPVQKLTYFSAGIPAAAAHSDGAVALVELLRSKLGGGEGVAVLRAAGFEPAPEPPHPLRG